MATLACLATPALALAQHERTADPPPTAGTAPAASSMNAPPEEVMRSSATKGGDQDDGPRVHRGFYVRAALGGGFARDGLSYTGPFGLKYPSGEASGGSVVGDLALAGSLKPGMFLGGAFFFEQVASPKVTVDGLDVPNNVSVGTLLFIGPYFDWYFDPHKGMHLMASVGGARITTKDKNGNASGDSSPVGGGLVAGFGYDWWIADHWSAGLLGRVTFASMKDGNANVSHTWTAFSVVGEITYD
jgi:hypothetical protein